MINYNYRSIIAELDTDEWMIPENFLSMHEEFLQAIVNKVEEKVIEEKVREECSISVDRISMSNTTSNNSITLLNLDYTHNKSGNLYTVLHMETINATNEQDGDTMVIYTREGHLYTRELKEFNEKFTRYIEPIKKGDSVLLPYNEEGVVTHIKDIPWGFKYEVIITKGSMFNEVNDIVDFKEEQLTKIN
jgi:hypothetical protein